MKMTNNKLAELKEAMIEGLKGDTETLRSIVSEMNSYDGSMEHLEVHENDEDFFETFFSGNAYEAVRATYFGDFDYGDEYIRFNGYGNLETLSEYELDQELLENLDEIIENMVADTGGGYDFSYILSDELQETLAEAKDAYEEE